MQLVNDYFRTGNDDSEVKSIEFSGTFRCYGSEGSASSASQSGFLWQTSGSPRRVYLREPPSFR
jgi:hypothetical protein